ncbi:MAG: hypothetical protein DLM58_07925 [Pseudonocardiales bacterium]|nr:MAG: hypothetical protein DLM58_07925 [Pseudonocardiales bacterium]
MRNPRARLVVGAAVLVAATTAALVAPSTAQAAPSGDTTVTFTLTAGALNITTPTSAALGSAAAAAGTLTAQLGTVTVTDARGRLLGAWTTSVTSTSFTTGAATAAETLPNSAVSYWSGAATATTGLGAGVPGQLLAAAAQDLSTSRTAFSKIAGVGNNSSAWNPTLIVTVPAAAVAGAYTGTVTHSVA